MSLELGVLLKKKFTANQIQHKTEESKRMINYKRTESAEKDDPQKLQTDNM